MHPSQVIQQLENTNSRLEKEAIIRAAWHAGCTEFFEGAQQALDNLITYGVQKVPIILEDDQVPHTFGWTEFQSLAQQLSSRTLTGNAARDALRSAAESCTTDHWNFWYRRLLLKDLKAGVSEKTINAVLSGLGPKAKSYQVPVFSCQLAKSAADHPKKLKGVKWLDNKYDGCLSEEWVIEFEDGSKVSIGEVVNNTIEGRVKSYNTQTRKIEYNDILGWSKNINLGSSSHVRWFRLTLDNGVQLPPLTGNHLIWLPKLNCWRRVDALKPGDSVLEK